MGTPMTYISGNTGTYQSGTFNKGTIALNLNPSSLASGNNWYNGVDVTATQYLIYSDTYSQGQATQANSKPTAWTTPDLSDTSLLNLINTLPDRVGVLPFTSLPLALQWLNATNKYFLIKTNYENIVTSGLVLNLDAGWYNSYSGTTTWFDIKGGYNNTLINSPTYSSTNQGAILFDGIDNYCKGDILASTFSSDFSIGAWFYHTSYQQWEAIFSNNAASTSWSGNDKDAAILGFRGWDNTGGNFDITKKTIGINGVGTTPDGVFLDLGDHLNQWIYVCLTRSGTNIEITAFKQGQILYTAGTYSYTIQTRNAYLIGRHWYNNGSNGQNFGGYIPIVQVYNKKLSDSEILQNYNAQKSRFGFYDIVQSGLTHSYDAANYLSYPRSGTTWFDMTSTANNGTLVNGPTFNTGTTPSIQFDGSDDYINATNTKFIGSVPSTFEFWLNPSTVTNANVEQSFLQVGNANTNQMRLYFLRDSKFAVAYYSNDFTFNYTAVANTIYHAVFTENGSGTVQLYINGVLVNSGNLTPPNTQGSTYWIGRYSNTRFNGKMFSHRAYNRVLLAQEVVQNYEAQRGIYGATGYTTSGLTLNLDAGNYASYPTTGTKWVDISGNYNNGDLINGPTWSSTSGGILTFDGVDDYVTIPSFSLPVGSFSCEAFFQWASLGSDKGSIFSLNYNYPNSGYLIRQKDDSSGKFVIWSDYGSESGIFSTAALTVNTWNHVVVVQSAGTCLIYINGVLDSSQSLPNPVLSQSYPILLGTRALTGSVGAFLSGKIATCKIYNRALSASEVLQNYNALKGRFGL